jgi:DNA-directed RNA polymerase subunit RPC12/RpoP
MKSVVQALCLLCRAALNRASPRGAGTYAVCAGCAERLELELTLTEVVACPDCGRHRELCALQPCSSVTPQPQRRAKAARQSGAERVQRIERMAAMRLGVRELSRRTGYAASTISRWLKIDRCAILKHALQTEAVDIGRAKLLADAPEGALADLIQLAPHVSRAELGRRVAALRASAKVVRKRTSLVNTPS